MCLHLENNYSTKLYNIYNTARLQKLDVHLLNIYKIKKNFSHQLTPHSAQNCNGDYVPFRLDSLCK